MEALLILFGSIFIFTWLIFILFDGDDNVGLSITSIISLVLFISIMGIYSNSKEYKGRMVNRCEWIINNQQQYMTYGEPK